MVVTRSLMTLLRGLTRAKAGYLFLSYPYQCISANRFLEAMGSIEFLIGLPGADKEAPTWSFCRADCDAT